MEGELVIIQKSDLLEALENTNRKIIDEIITAKQCGKDNAGENPKVKRLNTREIKEMIGVGDTTFEKIQDELPLHRTKTGRMFAYEHDLIIYLFREHPPYFDINRFREYITQNNLIQFMNKK